MRSMESADLLALKPGIHFVLGRYRPLCELALRHMLRVLRADPTFYRVFDGHILLDTQRKVGLIHDFGNGQHYTAIEELFEFLRDTRDPRQQGVVWLCSTMNSWVVDRVSLEFMEDARQKLIFAWKEPEGIPQVFNDNELETFWTAYKTGIQHVSEILISEGFW